MNNNPSQYKEKVKLGQKDRVELSCDNCGNSISGKDININNSLAKCENCQAVFNLKSDHFFIKNDRPGRPEMIMPEGTDVLTLTDSLDIRVDWLKSNPKSSLGFLTFFTVMWNGFLGVMAAGFLSSGAFENIIFLSIHLIVGLGLIYYLASVYMNYTDIIVTNSYLEISQRPIPNPFSPTISIRPDEIEQLYVSKYVESTSNGQTNYAYGLHAILKNRKKVLLLKGMNRETQLYIEQEIERYLNIQDQDISGTIRE